MKRTAFKTRTTALARGRMKRRARKKRPEHDAAHRAFIRRLPCLICGGPSECAHVRFSDASWEKVNPGTGRKEDRWCVPLCPDHHRLSDEAQHNSGERVWWERHGIDALAIASALWSVSGDHEQGLRIVCGLQAAE